MSDDLSQDKEPATRRRRASLRKRVLAVKNCNYETIRG